jgi:chromosome segregation ATPase
MVEMKQIGGTVTVPETNASMVDDVAKLKAKNAEVEKEVKKVKDVEHKVVKADGRIGACEKAVARLEAEARASKKMAAKEFKQLSEAMAHLEKGMSNQTFKNDIHDLAQAIEVEAKNVAKLKNLLSLQDGITEQNFDALESEVARIEREVARNYDNFRALMQKSLKMERSIRLQNYWVSVAFLFTSLAVIASKYINI